MHLMIQLIVLPVFEASKGILLFPIKKKLSENELILNLFIFTIPQAGFTKCSWNMSQI